MQRAAALWQRIRDWTGGHGTELRLGVRMTAAGVLAFALAHMLALPQGYWAVFTAVIVTQASVGGSLKATLDRLVGTVGGGAYGAIVASLIPHNDALALGAALAVALAPLAVLAALYPSFRIAPVTAVIVLVGGAGMHIAPLVSAIDRVIEISLGSIVGLGVSLLLLPARAHGLLAEAASRALALLAQLSTLLFSGLTQGVDRAAAQRLQDSVRMALTKLATTADEAKRERQSHLTDAADPEPVLRTVRRLSNDLIMIGRAAAEPLPEPLAARLAPALARVSEAAAGFLRDTGAALAARRPPPPLDAVDAAFDAYAAEMAELRRARLTQDQPADAVGRLFALGFALEQLRRDFTDIGSRAADLARPG
jgi:uncharacterized membrane protein YccC